MPELSFFSHLTCLGLAILRGNPITHLQIRLCNWNYRPNLSTWDINSFLSHIFLDIYFLFGNSQLYSSMSDILTFGKLWFTWFLIFCSYPLTMDRCLPLSLEDIFLDSYLNVFITRYLASLNLFSRALTSIRIHQYMLLSVQQSNNLHFHDEKRFFGFDSPWLCCISEEGQLTFLYYSFKCILTFF